MKNFKASIEYDGSDFAGWQIQPEQRTVQGVIEEALRKLTSRQIRVTGSGRTDAGVHAWNQVANFHTDCSFTCDVFYNGLNSLLSKDVRILKVEEVPDTFNARFSALKRIYRYRITKKKKAVGRQYLWEYPYRFDLDIVRKESQFLLGEHDFKSFVRSDSSVTSTLCQVDFAEWHENEDEICFRIGANRFLHNMVRSIVGTLLEIGRGRFPEGSLPEIIAAMNRSRAGMTAPARGLILEKVLYE